MMVVGGSASGSFAQSLSSHLSCKLLRTETKRFPDGEFYARFLDDVNGEDVVVVQTTYPDPKIIELLIMKDSLNELGAKSITVVAPYFGYARQDKTFQDGEGISARAMARHVGLGADRVVSIDIHTTKILEWLGDMGTNVSAMPDIARFMQERELGIDTIVSPDKGSVERAKLAANTIGVEFDHLEKTRIDGKTVKITPKNMDVEGKTVAIVDDIIATGGTIVTAAKQLRDQGARNIYAACTHGLFTGGAIPKLQDACTDVFCCNTIENDRSVIDASGAVARLLSE